MAKRAWENIKNTRNIGKFLKNTVSDFSLRWPFMEPKKRPKTDLFPNALFLQLSLGFATYGFTKSPNHALEKVLTSETPWHDSECTGRLRHALSTMKNKQP